MVMNKILKNGLNFLKIIYQKVSFIKRICLKTESVKAFFNLYLQLNQKLIRYLKVHFGLDTSLLTVESDKTKINLPSKLHKSMIMIKKKENVSSQFPYPSALCNPEYRN